MRYFIPIAENKIYCQILYNICIGNDYAQNIHKRLGKKSSVIVRQLAFLEEERYLTSRQEQYLNKKRYEINYSKLIEDIIQKIKQKRNELYKQGVIIHGSKQEFEKWLKYVFKDKWVLMNRFDDKTYEKRFLKNKYLIILLRDTLKHIAEQQSKSNYNEVTLERIYNLMFLHSNQLLTTNKLFNIPSKKRGDEIIKFLNKNQDWMDYMNFIFCLATLGNDDYITHRAYINGLDSVSDQLIEDSPENLKEWIKKQLRKEQKNESK